MKRTPLKRKTPIKRGGSLKPQSTEKARWRGLYRAMKNKVPFQRCVACGNLFHISEMEPHHPYGQANKWILVFVWLCQSKHRHIEDNGKESRALGWIHPRRTGRPDDDSIPRPWEAMPSPPITPCHD